MSENRKINAAYRLHTILKVAVAQPQNISNLQVWTNVFDVHLSGRRQKQAVSRGIDLIYEQLDILVKYLKSKEYTDDAINDLISGIEGNVSMEFINVPWNDFKTRLTNQLIPLSIYSSTLPNEESPLSPTDLKDIQDELDRLEHSLEEKDLPAEVREYVKKQLSFIRRAFWEYKFRGLHAFEDAVMDGIREVYVQKDIVENHKDDAEVKEVSKMWSRIWQVVIKAGQVNSALNAGEHFLRLVASTFTGHPH
ncbi:MAG TPA: hypothetical protein VGK21_13855 [Candidatus Angelobacter sp.]|jgi:ribosomal protein S15P/S13E